MEKRSLILLHGALADSSQMEGFASLLRVYYDVHLINFEGHGSAGLAGGKFTLDNFVSQVVSFMNDRGIAKANFFGYSMGGYVALAVASRFPNMADRIVTLGTKLAWDRSNAEKEVLNLNPVVLEAKVPLYSEKLKALHTAIGWIKVLQLTADFMKSLGESPMREAEFASINSPVLILTGEKDKMVSAAESLVVAELIPNGRSTVLSGMPHPFEQVDENVLKDVVLDFLK